MTDGYAERRREYVASIRSSFDTGENDGIRDEDSYGADGVDAPFSFFRLELLAAVMIFGVFLYLQFTGEKLYGYQAKDIIEMVSDNHYYLALEEILNSSF